MLNNKRGQFIARAEKWTCHAHTNPREISGYANMTIRDQANFQQSRSRFLAGLKTDNELF